MSYSQKPLLDLLKAGAIPGEGKPLKHIETVISNVFLFETHVYKLYKNDNDFFNKNFQDISGKSERFSFTRRDFKWNHALSPSIYLEIKGVSVKEGAIEFFEPTEDAEELLIFMRRVDTKDVLFEKLMRGEVTEEVAFSIGEQFANHLKKARENILTGHDYYQLFTGRVGDLRAWISSVPDLVSEEEARGYCDYLQAVCDKNKERFKGEFSRKLVHGGDIHSHNAILSNGELLLMDTFPPKEDWRIEHKLISFYRMGTDILALSGRQEVFESFMRGCEKGDGEVIDRSFDDFYIVYAASIMVPYLYLLQGTDPEKKIAASRFHEFLRSYFARLRV